MAPPPPAAGLVVSPAASVMNHGHPIDQRGVKHLLDTHPSLHSLPPAYVLSKHVVTEPVAPQQATASVPVIDLGGLESPDDTSKAAATNEAIVSACADRGFFLVVNHGIEPALLEEMVRAAEVFFSLPLEEKMKYSANEDMAPVRYGSSVNATVPQPHLYWRDYLRHFGRPVIDETIDCWPSNPPNYRDSAKQLLLKSWDLAVKLARAMSEGLGEESGYLEGEFKEGFQTMSCNYYPHCPQPELALGVEPHTDQGAISVLMDNNMEGLQMEHEGKWVQVPMVPGALIITLGDQVEKASRGAYKSAKHRVVLSKSETRVSVAVGNGAPPEEIVGCSKLVLRFV